jgi:hypothetical protein
MKNARALSIACILIVASCLAACATRATNSDLAIEQERCAGYWRRSGDPDRTQEMSRRSVESRRAGSQISEWDDFFGELLVLVLTGGTPRTEPVKQVPHPSDSRGCE